MSTETTKKKIKIDNGTTFGRTYTDKAVDELLQSVGGSAVGVIELNNNQYQELQGNSLTLNAVQAEIIKTHQLIILRHGNDLEYKGVVCKYNGIYTLTMLSGNFMYYMIIMNFEKANLLTPYRFPTRLNLEYVSGEHYLKLDDGVSGSKVYLSTVNGTPIAFNYKENIKDYTFTEDKTISLFGEHSILVPKNSTDADILPLPADASTSTYVLKAVNGTVQWVKEA